MYKGVLRSYCMAHIVNLFAGLDKRTGFGKRTVDVFLFGFEKQRMTCVVLFTFSLKTY